MRRVNLLCLIALMGLVSFSIVGCSTETPCLEGTFVCSDGATEYDRDQINDGFCDCGESCDDEDRRCMTNADCTSYMRCVHTTDEVIGECKCPDQYECCVNRDCGDLVCDESFFDVSSQDNNPQCMCSHCGGINYPCVNNTACQEGLICIFPDWTERIGFCTKSCTEVGSQCYGDIVTGWDSYCYDVVIGETTPGYCWGVCTTGANCPDGFYCDRTVLVGKDYGLCWPQEGYFE